MSQPKLLFIKNVENEGPGLFGSILKGKKIPFDVIEYYDNPEVKIEDYSGFIVLGGPMSGNDNLIFIKKEISLIKQIIHTKKPFLGMCLGSQLLSKALGGSIKKNQKKEIGIYNIELSNEGKHSLIFNDIQGNFQVFQWHGETFSIPSHAKLLATSESCLNQAFQYNNAIGIQFHVEFTPLIVKSMVKMHEIELTQENLSTNDVLIEFNGFFPTLKQIGEIIFENFLTMIIKIEE